MAISTHTNAEIKRLAEQTLANAGVTGTFPTPLEKVAGTLGFVCFAFEGKSEMAGAIRYSDKAIFVNQNDPTERQRFTLAHEIGHAVLHDGESKIDYRVSFEKPVERAEVEANRFAAEILMPENVFRSVWDSRGGDANRVAKYFGVSYHAATIRAANLNLR